MSGKENKRKCLKCGASPAEDGIKLFRVLKPGVRNLVRCEQWAKYLFPEGNFTSVEFQAKLYNEHRMLCDRHFKDEDFTDGSRKHLLKTAVPCHIEKNLNIFSPDQAQDPGPSKIMPLENISNLVANEESASCTSYVKTNIGPGSSVTTPTSEKQKIHLVKCKKYMRRICQLQHRIKNLKSKVIINTLVDDKEVKKLSAKLSPSFALLLQGQIRNTTRKIRGRRWSKEEKITALRIFKRSPTCYRLLRRLFTLPSPGTLKMLLNKVPFGVGCNEAVFKIMKKFICTQKPEDTEFILMFDEMSLKKHLYYNVKHDVIEGYQDHGLQGRTRQIAAYALVFMIGGIRKRIKQPIAHYFSSSFSTADRLAVLIKEVLHHCAEAGIKIAATVCDMDGVNRRALAILGASLDHPYIVVENREIVCMYDVPHLLKCFRNLFLKYNIESTANIHSNEKTGKGVAKWSHIRDFYDIDNTNPNFVFAPCLKKEHLDPNTKQKMKVNLAAQVLSHSVAAGMFAKISNGTLTTEATVTANVLANMDKLFDALNSDCADLRRGKPFATNITGTTFHMDLFLKMKSFFTTLKFVGSPRKPPSQEGWVWTIKAVERLWINLQKKYKYKSLATRRLQQDPLENLFGCIRGNCGSNTNPTCGQFLAGLKTAILSNLSHVGTKGNCETDNSVIINNFDTLLSVSQPRTPTHTEAEPQTNFNVSSLLSFEIDEAIKEGTAEIQACAYVCGFLVRLLPTNTCENCKKIFLTPNFSQSHVFVECREYNHLKRKLNYVTNDLIACVEFCASLINDFLRENSQINSLKKNVIKNLKSNANFDFMAPCAIHVKQNINTVIESIFFICTKRFCNLKNRALTEEASASALKRKMNIILHK